MSRMKEKNLRRFVAVYIAGSIAFGGVAYAEEGEDYQEHFQDGRAIVVDDAAYANDGVSGGSFNGSVAASDITINHNGSVYQVTGGGNSSNPGVPANVGEAKITVNGGTVVDLYGGGSSVNGATANITGKSVIEITDGTVENVTGGGLARSGNALASVGESVITINGGSRIGFFQGGGDASGNGANANVDKTTITINGGTIGGDIYGDESMGGGYVTAGSTAGAHNASNVGDVTIHIHQGSFKNNIYGGGFSGEEDEDEGVGLGTASAHVNHVEMNINGGMIEADVYAGGVTDGDASKVTSTVDQALINISGGEIKGNVYAGGMNSATVGDSTINISGGKIGGNIAADQNVTGDKTLNFTAGEGSTVGGKISGYDVITVKEGAATTLTGERMAADESHGFTRLQVERRGILNISGGAFQADIQGAGAAAESALNFTAGKGSTISGTVSGFDAVTVANGAKTNWTGANLTHQFGALTVAEGGEINIAGSAVTFDFAPISSAAYSSRMARDVQSGSFNVNGAVNLASGTTLTLQNGTVTTGTKGAFVSAVGQTALANSGKLNWGTNAVVDGDLHMDFRDISADTLEAMGKTDDFAHLLENVVGSPVSADGQPVVVTNREDPTAEVAYEASVASDGSVTLIGAPRIVERGFSYYTGARRSNAYIVQNMVGNIHEHTAGLRNGTAADSFWAGVRGGSTDVETGFGDAEVNAQFYQLGYDWDLSANHKQAAVGLYFTKIAGDSRLNGVKNDFDSAYDFGVYGVQEFGGGNYLSLVGRYGRIGNSLRINDATVDWKDKGYGLSLEFGNRNTQANGLMIEPYLQMNYNHLSSADFVSGMGTAVSIESSALCDGRIGLRLIQQEAGNSNNTVYGGIAYTRGLSGDFSMKTDQGTRVVEEDNDANAFEVSLGMNRQVSACSTLSFNAKKEFGDYDGWSVEGTVQVAF